MKFVTVGGAFAEVGGVGVLLAVDLGLAAGLAVFGPDGVLRDWRAVRFPDRARYKVGVHAIVAELGPALDRVVAEGDPRLAKVWAREVGRYGVTLELVAADAWRPDLLLPREQRDRAAAKAAALRLAAAEIAASGCTRPVGCGHDAAEAICLGRWACGSWDPFAGGPAPLRRPRRVGQAARAGGR